MIAKILNQYQKPNFFSKYLDFERFTYPYNFVNLGLLFDLMRCFNEKFLHELEKVFFFKSVMPSGAAVINQNCSLQLLFNYFNLHYIACYDNAIFQGSHSG